MTRLASAAIGILIVNISIDAQVRTTNQPPAPSIVIDPANGLPLDDAVARALEREPSLRSSRAQVDVARGLQVQRTATVGRYDATAEFGMAGAWHMALEWDGPVGHGSINFEGAVQ